MTETEQQPAMELAFTAMPSDLLKQLAVVKKLGPDGLCIYADGEGSLSFRFMDIAYIMMVKYRIPVENLVASGLSRIMVDVESLITSLKVFGASDEVDFTVEGGFLNLKCGRKRRKMPLLDESTSKLPPEPKYKPERYFTANAKELRESFSDAARICDAFFFIGDGETWRIQGGGVGFKGSYDMEFESDEFWEARSFFSSDYLDSAAAFYSMDDKVRVSVETDAPIVIVGSRSVILFAPRIEHEASQ